MITRKNPLFFWINSLHKVTLFSTLSLILIGIVISFSLSYAASEKVGLVGTTFFTKQLIFTLATLFIMFILSFQSLDTLKWFCFIGFFITMVFLAMTLFGISIKGSKRWITFFRYSLQPSEIMKPFYVYVFSTLFTAVESAKIRSQDHKKILACAIITHVVILLLLFLQPDFGMIVIFNILFIILFYINTNSIKHFFIFTTGFLLSITILGLCLDHVKYRIKTFFFGFENYQVKLSFSAIQNGGFFGKGFAESKLKFILPEAHNDFIFAILIEEFGFIFAAILGLIFLLFIFSNFTYIFNFKQKIVTMFSKLYYTGEKMTEENIIHFIKKNYQIKDGKKYLDIYSDFLFCRNFIFLSCVLIFFEFFINASVSLALAPTKGMAMPFISYGGSSLISHGILIGSLLVINRKRYFFLM